MQKETTYHELMLIMQDIETQSVRSITYCIFNAQKIKQFHSQNAIRIELFNGTLEKMIEKYAKKDEKGRPVVMMVDNQQQMGFENDDDKQMFQAEYAELLKKPIQLHL